MPWTIVNKIKYTTENAFNHDYLGNIGILIIDSDPKALFLSLFEDIWLFL